MCIRVSRNITRRLLSARARVSRARAAFTLIEMLVATAILLIIVVMLGAMTSHVSRMWTEINGQSQRRTIGRALLQFMARDIQQARLSVPSWQYGPSPDAAYFYPTFAGSGSNGTLQFLVNDLAVTGTACMNPCSVFWQAPVAENSTQGNIAEVGYFVQWDTTTTPGKPKAYLCRYYVDATSTSGTAPYFGIYSSGTDAWVSGTSPLMSATAVAPATPSHSYSGWLADNVIGLWVRCVVSGTSTKGIVCTGSSITGFLGPSNPFGAVAIVPPNSVNTHYTYDSEYGYGDPLTNLSHPGPALPPAVEITMVVLDSNTAAKITPAMLTGAGGLQTYNATSPTLLSGTGAGSVKYYVSQLPPDIRQGAEIFSTTVLLQNVMN